MQAIQRALKKGPVPLDLSHEMMLTETGEGAVAQPAPTSPKRKRRAAALDAPEPTPVAKQHLSVREDGDIDLGMLDQEAFARVIASEQQQQSQPATDHKSMDEEDDEGDGPVVVDDVTYRP